MGACGRGLGARGSTRQHSELSHVLWVRSDDQRAGTPAAAFGMGLEGLLGICIETAMNGLVNTAPRQCALAVELSPKEVAT